MEEVSHWNGFPREVPECLIPGSAQVWLDGAWPSGRHPCPKWWAGTMILKFPFNSNHAMIQWFCDHTWEGHLITDHELTQMIRINSLSPFIAAWELDTVQGFHRELYSIHVTFLQEKPTRFFHLFSFSLFSFMPSGAQSTIWQMS